MSAGTGFEYFETELNRLVGYFGERLSELKRSSYVEAQLRDDFLNPFFRALGWDMENRAGMIQQKREVEIESRKRIGGRQKRAGRDNLYMYMRHWTASLLKRERYALFKRLPWEYALGKRLP